MDSWPGTDGQKGQHSVDIPIVIAACLWIAAMAHCLLRRDVDWGSRLIYLMVIVVTTPIGAAIYLLLMLRGVRSPSGRG